MHKKRKFISITEGYHYTKEEIGIEDNKFYEKINKMHIVDVYSKKDNTYVFKFVGIITFREYLICLFPKFYPKTTKLADKRNDISIIIKVLKKYKSTHIYYDDEGIFLNTYNKDCIINEIALADYIINDYVDFGLYRNKSIVSKVNNGNYDNWLETSSKIIPIQNEYVILYDNIIKNRGAYIYNNITFIHCRILSYIYENYGDIFGIQNENFFEFYEKDNLDFNEIIEILEHEINITYKDRESELLRALLYFYKDTGITRGDKDFCLYGTKYFHWIWEDICKKCFGVNEEILKQKIAKPKWINNNFEVDEKRETLEPDILIEYEENFLILDAKYYNLELNEPGIGDIIKQYSYELACMKYIREKNIFNLFLFPRWECENIMVNGAVDLDIYNLNLIINLYMPSEKMFSMYIENRVFDKFTINTLLEDVRKYYSNYYKEIVKKYFRNKFKLLIND